MPKQKRGVDKFGTEHEIKKDPKEKRLSAGQVRSKAGRYVEDPSQ
ncbi:MAG: hypothetical protein P4N41_07380 [Negativicutes bacterium]|nr:hypothetical protein [Negativicutes bacterium]